MITPKMKDYILRYIVENEDIRIMIDCTTMASELNTTSVSIEKILNQFERLNLCKINNYYGDTCDITVQAEADDLMFRGGFVFQEEILKANLDKLAIELEYLSKETSGTTLNRVYTMLSILGIILQAAPSIDGK